MTWKHNEDCHAHGGWCEECTAQGLRRRRNAENRWRKEGGGGETVRVRGDITLLAQRRRMWPLSGFRMRCAAVLTNKLPDNVGGGCASSLSLQATKPRANASLSILLPRERGAAPSLQRGWFSSSSQHGRRCQSNLSAVSPSGFAFRDFRVGHYNQTGWCTGWVF